MSCSRCDSNRLMFLSGHAKDLHDWEIPHLNIGDDGYAPDIENVCGGDDINLTFCLDCGQIQNFKPITDQHIFNWFEDEDCIPYIDDDDDDDDDGIPYVPYISTEEEYKDNFSIKLPREEVTIELLQRLFKDKKEFMFIYMNPNVINSKTINKVPQMPFEELLEYMEDATYDPNCSIPTFYQ